MASCEPYQTELLGYLYNLLESDELQALREHLHQCSSCQAALVRAELQAQLLAAAAKTEFPAVTPPATPPPIEEIYSQLKLPDELLSGVYANVVMIAHSAAEFYFDFITSFYPRSAVSCRVFFSAPQIPGVLNTLTRSYQQYQQKLASGQLPKPDHPG